MFRVQNVNSWLLFFLLSALTACRIPESSVTVKTTKGSAAAVSDENSPSSPSVVINAGASYTNSTSVTLTLSAVDASQMYVSNTAGCASGGTWEAYGTSKAWILGQTNATATVYAKFKDTVGNETACVSDTIIHDSTGPTVTISTTSPSTTNVSPIPVTITFSESVTGFDVSDIAVGNGTAGGFSGSGTTYSVNVTPTAQGAVTLNVAAGVAQDSATNGNTAATQLSVTYTFPWIGTKQLGSSMSTIARSIATDFSGNVFIGGYTNGHLDGNSLTGTNDFFLTKYGNSGVKQWTKQLGILGQHTFGQRVATDASGGVFIVGTTFGGLDGNTLMGSSDFFIAKFNNSGVKQWTKQFGVSGGYVQAHGVATDSLGNIFVGGFTNGGLDGNTLTSVMDSFVTKYNSSGLKQWTRQIGPSGGVVGANCVSVATDPSGNVFLGGYTNGGLDGNTLTGTQDFFVTKYDSSGFKQWTKQLGVSGADTLGRSVATDASGNVFIGGDTKGGLDGNTLMGTSDFFLTKYSSSGVKQWTKQLGVSGRNTSGQGVSVDLLGSVFISGVTSGGLDGNTLTGANDFFVTKYDSSGVKQWTKQLGVSGKNTFSESVATDPYLNVFIGGYTDGGLDGNTLTGTQDFFVTKYDSSGNKQ